MRRGAGRVWRKAPGSGSFAHIAKLRAGGPRLPTVIAEAIKQRGCLTRGEYYRLMEELDKSTTNVKG